MSTKYICAIETGSYSDTTPRTYERHSDTCVCGRTHRTYSAAAKCKQDLADAKDAAWLSARIHDASGRRVDPSYAEQQECHDLGVNY